MVKYLGWFLGLLALLISHMAPSLPTPLSSLAHRHTTSVRNARHGAMLPSSAVPRRSPTHPHAPFRGIANEVSHIQNAPSTRPVSPSLDRASVSFRDADCERKLVLQESPSRRLRLLKRPLHLFRVHRAWLNEPEGNAKLPLEGSKKRLLLGPWQMRLQGPRKNAGNVSIENENMPTYNRRIESNVSVSESSSLSNHLDIRKVLQLVPIQQEEPRGRRLPRKTIVQRPSNDVGSVNGWSAKMEWQHHLKIVGEMHRQHQDFLGQRISVNGPCVGHRADLHRLA
ncbi:hypothetical protein B0H17DRAFT_1151129 [Mycena rosella]|uniref:Uncharacterized protein n=1 Tax=Mycena rosella TaxID=1033263 RepID=A0AAD7BMH0_MYCRO|nr:hypothetical protein B0H17DRAFT_1151129 [Mycena rosella]